MTAVELLTPAEVAAILRTTPAVLKRWRYLGRGPAHIKPEGRVLYPRAELDAYLASARRAA